MELLAGHDSPDVTNRISKGCFFEKKKQKTFVNPGPWQGGARAESEKVFLLLFIHKKKVFPSR
jgi:hypothetical protein